MQARAYLQFVSAAGNAWRHGLESEDDARKTGLALAGLPSHRDVWISLLHEGGRIEDLSRPPGTENFSLESLLGKTSVGTRKSQGRRSAPNQMNATERTTGNHMSMTIGILVKGTLEETLAGAKETISAYFQGFAAKKERIIAAAKKAFSDSESPRMRQATLVGGVLYLCGNKASEFHISGELTEDMVIEVLKSAGFDGIGQRGAKGVALPGAPAAVSAPSGGDAPPAAAVQSNNKGNKDKQARA